jgi:hypothetical protein
MTSLLNPARPAGAQSHKELYGPNICLPPEAAVGRIKTYWGTVVFADCRTGKLRHCSELSSPSNVIIADTNGAGYLLHITQARDIHTRAE